MIKTLKANLLLHGKTMLIVFEVFWILVFLLDRMSGQSANGIPQFVYVNF